MLPSPPASPDRETRLRGLERLAALLDKQGRMERQARMAGSVQELEFLMVNETRQLVPYRQAALWFAPERDAGRVTALSGVAEVDVQVPYVAWLTRVMKRLSTRMDDAGVHLLGVEDLPEEQRDGWLEWFPGYALWCPLRTPDGSHLGGIVLAREQPWQDGERHILDHLAETWAHALELLLLKRRRRWWRFRKGETWLKPVLALALFGLMWLPVRQSVLAPAEVTAWEPTLVRAPLEGVVDRLHVQPNEAVQAGQPLLNLDDVTLKNRLEVARRTLEITQAKHRQAAQQAVFDKESQAHLEILKREMEKQTAEAAYLEELLERIQVRAPRAGIAVFDDVNDWLGRPVAMGEKILLIADPRQVELTLQLPADSAIPLQPGGDVLLFLGIDPEHPLDAVLSFISYQPAPVPEGFLAYRLRAGFRDEAGMPPPRIGLRGTAKVYGERVTLFHYLFRRPLAALRQAVGW